MPRDGRRPVRLSGYGGFNIPVQPTFTALNAAWLQLGGALAYPNIRGGGEYGRAWHEAAVKTRRQNAFDDYIAAAQWLVSAGYTTPSKLVSRGNSNGGLLVAVTAMQAPEAFGAVFCRVPNLDMLGFTRWRYQDAATVEYGSPDDPIEGQYLAGYSPYHNVQADRRYPVMMFVPAFERPGRAAARCAQDGRQAPDRGDAGRSLFSAAAPGLGTRRRHDADRAHRTRRRRAQLLLLGARHHAVARRSVRQKIGGRTVSHPGVPGGRPSRFVFSDYRYCQPPRFRTCVPLYSAEMQAPSRFQSRPCI
jgi:Prolyl oligopeptidase family